MKKIVALIVALVFALSMTSVAFAADAPKEDKCGKCHKNEKALDKVVGAKKIDSAEGLKKAVRGGEKAKLHEKLTDADLADAAKTLKLK